MDWALILGLPLGGVVYLGVLVSLIEIVIRRSKRQDARRHRPLG